MDGKIAVGIVATLAVFLVVGYVGVVIMNGVGAAPVSNTSSFSYTSNIGGETNIGALAFVLMLIVAIVAGWYAVSTLERFARVWNVLVFLCTQIVHAIVGAVTLGTVYGAWLIYSAVGSSIHVEPIMYAYTLGGFIICAAVGYAVRWFGEKLLTRVKESGAVAVTVTPPVQKQP